MKGPAARDRPTVLPCLLVESIQDELEFLRVVFGAQVVEQRGEQERTLWRMEVRLGDSVMLLGRTKEESTPSSSTLYVWSDDLDGAYARAMEAGATLISSPAEQPSGVREAGFKDPQGTIWWLGQRTGRLSNREVEQKLMEQRRSRL